MGMFPYECCECGGGYERCSNTNNNKKRRKGNVMFDCDDINCCGGQFCWESKCYIKDADNEWIKAFYTGYGNFLVNKNKNWKSFKEYDDFFNKHGKYQEYYSLNLLIYSKQYFDAWKRNGNKIDNICYKVICRSCFNKRKDK